MNERGQAPSAIRTVLPNLLSQYKLDGRAPGSTLGDDTWIEELARTIFRGSREQAVLAAALSTIAAIAYFKIAVLPELDQRYSVRPFWRANASQIESACLQDVRRDWVYGLNYYAARALPECSGSPRQNAIRDFPLRIAQP